MSAEPTVEPTEASAASSSAAAAPLAASHCVADGSWVLLIFGDGERRLVRVRKGSKTSAGKQQVLMDALVGAPYGANFRVEPGGLVRDPRTVEEISGSVGDAFADVVDAKEDASNAELFDDGSNSTAQRLGDADIRRLKQKGVHGAELVKTIAQNSATFAGKTAFAQDKYAAWDPTLTQWDPAHTRPLLTWQVPPQKGQEAHAIPDVRPAVGAKPMRLLHAQRA